MRLIFGRLISRHTITYLAGWYPTPDVCEFVGEGSTGAIDPTGTLDSSRHPKGMARAIDDRRNRVGNHQVIFLDDLRIDHRAIAGGEGEGAPYLRRREAPTDTPHSS